MALLDVENLTVTFDTQDGVVRAVDDLSYQIDPGETVGVVGESGAGKSVAARAVLGLIDAPDRVERGRVVFDGTDLLALDDDELRPLRGDRIAMVFQDAGAALDPVYPVGEQIAEGVRHHLEYDDQAAAERARWLLDRVGIPDPDERYDAYPHELSAGMKQRVGIAIGLSCDPDLLICDEPTSGLDVTTQATILELLDAMASQFDTALQLITHDMGVVADTCDRVAVLYGGRLVETAPVDDLFYDPRHPYTAGLLSALPRLGADRDRLPTIPGTMPAGADEISGCRFHPRCPFAEPVCASQRPPFVEFSDSGDSRQGAACLEHTGDLETGLPYEVVVTEEEGATAPDDRQREGTDD
jgi:peptide/nickel transport system ATP-binding protein